MKRLRVLDINTPWFWLTIFYYGQRYGKPSFELLAWDPHTWQKFWFHAWKWEDISVDRGEYAQASEYAQA